MYDEAWKEYFFDDKETRQALESSEIFQSYAKAELQREAMRNDPLRKLEKQLDEELRVQEDLERFQEQVNKRPLLRARLQLAKEALRKNPELKKSVDPNFLRGLELLDLGE